MVEDVDVENFLAFEGVHFDRVHARTDRAVELRRTFLVIILRYIKCARCRLKIFDDSFIKLHENMELSCFGNSFGSSFDFMELTSYKERAIEQRQHVYDSQNIAQPA